jgi:hypothetical protein
MITAASIAAPELEVGPFVIIIIIIAEALLDHRSERTRLLGN